MQEKHFISKYPDLFINRGNVEYHMEDFLAAVRDFSIAQEIDKEAGLGASIKKIQDRMEFTKTAFQRVVMIVIA